MIVVDISGKTLEVVLGGAVSATQLPFVVNYTNTSREGRKSIGSQHGTTNNTTAVAILGAPASGGRREAESISVYNVDTASATVTIRINDNGTTRIIAKVTLTTLDHLMYTAAAGWFVITSQGFIKSTSTAVNLDDLGDVAITSPATNSVLLYNGSTWLDSSVTYLNALTANRILYGSATDTVGTSSYLTFDGTTLTAHTLTVSTGLITSSRSGNFLVANGATTGASYVDILNTSGRAIWGVENSAGGGLFTGASAYSTAFGAVSNHSLHLATNNTVRFTIDNAGAVTIPGTLGVTGATTLSSTLTVSNSSVAPIVIESSNAAPAINNRTTATANASNTILTYYSFKDSGGTDTVFVYTQALSSTITDTAEVGTYHIATQAAGELSNSFSIVGRAVTIPGTLGVTGLTTVTTAGISVPVSALGTCYSATYTPTLNNTANISASTAYVCQYIRVGNVVTVSGRVDLTITTTLTDTQLGISLPVASDFANVTECGGTGALPAVADNPFGIYADVTNNWAIARATPINTGSRTMAFSFTYRII